MQEEIDALLERLKLSADSERMIFDFKRQMDEKNSVIDALQTQLNQLVYELNFTKEHSGSEAQRVVSLEKDLQDAIQIRSKLESQLKDQ